MDFPVFRLPLSVFVIVAPHSLIQGGEPQIVQVVQQGEPTLYKAVWDDYIYRWCPEKYAVLLLPLPPAGEGTDCGIFNQRYLSVTIIKSACFWGRHRRLNAGRFFICFLHDFQAASGY